MDHRNGQCTRCGATFKIPGTFTAHQARCRDCGGVVRVARAPAPARARREPRPPARVATPALSSAPAQAPLDTPVAPQPAPAPAPVIASTPPREPTRGANSAPAARRGRTLAWALAAAILLAISVWAFWSHDEASVQAAPAASVPSETHDARGE